MFLDCKKDWKAPDTSSDYAAGNRYDVRNGRGAELVRLAPAGVFEVAGVAPPEPAAPETPDPEPSPSITEEVTRPTDAAPDRQARGGRARRRGQRSEA